MGASHTVSFGSWLLAFKAILSPSSSYMCSLPWTSDAFCLGTSCDQRVRGTLEGGGQSGAGPATCLSPPGKGPLDTFLQLVPRYSLVLGKGAGFRQEPCLSRSKWGAFSGNRPQWEMKCPRGRSSHGDVILMVCCVDTPVLWPYVTWLLKRRAWKGDSCVV